MNNFTQKKTKKINGFMLFAKDFQRQCNERNQEIHDIAQAVKLAGPHWEKLSAAQKEEYRIKAKASEGGFDEIKPSRNKRKKFNCKGEDIAELELIKEIEKEKREKMISEIKLMLTEAENVGDLHSLVFYFINATKFYEDKNIYPAEIALSKFSLKEGVIDDIQIRINPGELPLGSASAAMAMSKETKLPLPPNCEGERDYMTVLEIIIDFLHPFDKLPMFFTGHQELQLFKATIGTLNKIFYESMEYDVLSRLKVYPIEELFFILQHVIVKENEQLNETSDEPFPSISSASYYFNADFGTLLPITRGCNFHNSNDAAQFCCLARVRAYGYTFAKWCSSRGRYPLKDGHHNPYVGV